MVITAASLEPQAAQTTGLRPELSGTNGCLPRRVSLSEASVSGTGVSVVDLTGEEGAIDFDVSNSFLDYLGKGNRILFRLRDLGQLQAVALMAYEHTLSFEFDRTAEGVSILIFKRDTRSGSRVPDDDGTGI